MKDPFARPSSTDVWILDGGFATELERRGKDLNTVRCRQSPRCLVQRRTISSPKIQLQRNLSLMQDHLWSARVLKDDPEVVQATHLSYFEAGEGSAQLSQLQLSPIYL